MATDISLQLHVHFESYLKHGHFFISLFLMLRCCCCSGSFADLVSENSEPDKSIKSSQSV